MFVPPVIMRLPGTALPEPVVLLRLSATPFTYVVPA